MKNAYLALIFIVSLVLVNGFTYYITQNSITNLKNETQQKIDSIESENKNIQQKIEGIMSENKNLKNEIIDMQSQLTSLKNDVNDLEKEIGLKWITIRNITGSGEYQVENPGGVVDWIHLNSTDLQISWSFKELSNISTGSQFAFGLNGDFGTLPRGAGGSIAGYNSVYLLEGSGTLSYNELGKGLYYLVVRGTNSTKWNIVVKYWSGS